MDTVSDGVGFGDFDPFCLLLGFVVGLGVGVGESVTAAGAVVGRLGGTFSTGSPVGCLASWLPTTVGVDAG
jgi:hypothetical protein